MHNPCISFLWLLCHGTPPIGRYEEHRTDAFHVQGEASPILQVHEVGKKMNCRKVCRDVEKGRISIGRRLTSAIMGELRVRVDRARSAGQFRCLAVYRTVWTTRLQTQAAMTFQ